MSFQVASEQFAALQEQKDARALLSTPTVSGTVVDPAGKPVLGAMVLLEERNFYRDYAAHKIPKTDDAGSFSIPDPSPDSHRLTIFSFDWAIQSVNFTVPLQKPLKIVLHKGKRVEFHAIDAKGMPITGIHFYPEASRDSAYEGDSQVLDFLGQRNLIKNTSDSRGVFVWENAPSEPLPYQIVSASVLSQPGGEYGPAGSPHTIVFRPRIPVRVKIVDAATGEPIKSYRIYEGVHFKANPPGFWTWDLRQRPPARPGGFDDSLKTLDRLIRYRIQTDGYRPSVSETFDAEKLPDKPVSIEFRLEKASDYSAVVRTPDGQPAAGAKVYTVAKRRGALSDFQVVGGVPSNSNAAAFTTADVEGEIRIVPGSDPFLCFISHESGYAELTDADLFQSAKIKLVPWAKVEGALRRGGKPAARVAVELNQGMPLGMGSALPSIIYRNHATTDADGKYRFDRCVAGEWSEHIHYDPVRARGSSMYQSALTIDLAPGQMLSQRFGTEGIDLRGHVSVPKDPPINWTQSPANFTWEPGAPPDAATKQPRNFQRTACRRDSMMLSKDGSFRFINLEPGDYELLLSLFAPGDDWARPSYSKKITITRKMFLGKTPTNPIDLNDIPVSPATR